MDSPNPNLTLPRLTWYALKNGANGANGANVRLCVSPVPEALERSSGTATPTRVPPKKTAEMDHLTLNLPK
jgi:hypothetical protein